MEILLATGNKNKVKELKDLLQGKKWDVKSLASYPSIVMPPETENTFLGNAFLKARVGAVASGLWTIADDSGIEVDWLYGKPGVYSARFAGPEQDDAQNNQKLLREMLNCPDEKRQARFVCAIALISPEGDEYSSVEICEGMVGKGEKGDNGFGYDSLFIVDGLGKTMAEISLEEKNKISHRAKALRGIVEILKNL